MSQSMTSSRRKLTVATGIVLALASFAQAHVVLELPDGGEVLTVGEVYTIQWRVLVGHDTENWDLWYSISGPGGPWATIAVDLPPGDISTGAVHTYEWTVPATPSDLVRVRVRQDNVVAPDYYDHSAGDLSIAQLGDSDGDGDVDSVDFHNWLDCVTGPETGPLAAGCATFDFDMDTDIDVADFAAFQQVFEAP